MTIRFAAICIDSIDPEPLAQFWCQVLDWAVINREEDGLSIGPADGDGPQIDFFAVPERKAGKNRVHVDVRAEDSTTEEELDRLLALGARRSDIGQEPDQSWVVLTDPEGNEFCLLGRCGLI